MRTAANLADGEAYIVWRRALAAYAAGVLSAACVLGVAASALAQDDLASQLQGEFNRHYSAAQYVDAEAAARRWVEAARRTTRDSAYSVGVAEGSLGHALVSQKRFGEAEAAYARSLEQLGRVLDGDDVFIARTRFWLADAMLMQGRDADARLEALLHELDAALESDQDFVNSVVRALAYSKWRMHKNQEAKALYERHIRQLEQANQSDSQEMTQTLSALAYACSDDIEREEAAEHRRRALSILERLYGANHPDVANAQLELATSESALGKFSDAEKRLQQALGIYEGLDNGGGVIDILHSLGHLYHDVGRHREAEQVVRRALDSSETINGPEAVMTAHLLRDLGHELYHLDHFADAEKATQRSLQIRRMLGGDDVGVAQSLEDLALVLIEQGREDEAKQHLFEAKRLLEAVYGPEHSRLAVCMANLADIHLNQGELDEAEALYQTASRLTLAAYGESDPAAAFAVGDLAKVFDARGRFDEAEQCYRKRLEILNAALPAEHPFIAEASGELGGFYLKRGRLDEAEPYLDDGIESLEQSGTSAHGRVSYLVLRARLAWQAGRRSDALLDLRMAMDLAENLRRHTNGAEHERAAAFARLGDAFEYMVEYQVELGDVSEAFHAIERSRARSLLDELSRAGANLDIGRGALETHLFQEREAELRGQIAALEYEIDELDSNQRGPSSAEWSRIDEQLRAARQALYQHFRDERSTNPIYRNLLSAGIGPPRLSQVQRELLDSNALMLLYFVGERGVYVIAATRERATLHRIVVDADVAAALGTNAGPLSPSALHDVLVGDDGVLEQISQPQTGDRATPRLHAMWKTIVPEAVRRELTSGQVERLFVVPDGALALLPMDVLVIEANTSPRYLIDVGPPIMYGPSATVMYRLVDREAPSATAVAEPVLSVADPQYPGAASGDQMAASRAGVSRPLARSRYMGASGELTRLPYTAWETAWVEQVFKKYSIGVAPIEGAHATEATVRQNVSGRTVVHFACHGLADQAYGNFFGALALTPGARGSQDAADDGFLTLAEICSLDLASCELAILSACQTNYGPQQKGEGVWGLSRGFIVAGSRRVVASNWLVDDEAAASLVSYYCALIGKGREQGELDYAASLHAAKRWLRGQPRWSSPYYWGTFVHIGPK